MLWGGRECGIFKKWKMAQGMMTAGIQGPDHSFSNKKDRSTREKAKDSTYINRDRPQIKECTFFSITAGGTE